MRYTWMFIFTVFLAGAIAFLAWYRYRINSIKRGKKHAAVIAHTSSITKLPAYKKARKRYYILLGAAAFLLASTLLSFTAIAARPIEIRADKRINATRDTILCLDTSGSMTDYVETIVSHFKKITDGLNGERIGITLFDSVAVNIVPLTDDYVVVSEILSELQSASVFTQYRTAISARANSTSNIGSGVMGCINSFDILGDERAQSVIVATDNKSSSTDKITHEQAVAYGKRYGVSMYGISISNEKEFAFPGNYDSVDSLVALNVDETTVGKILDRIFEKEAVKVETARELVAADTPEFFMAVGIISFAALMFVLWRLHL